MAKKWLPFFFVFVFLTSAKAQIQFRHLLECGGGPSFMDINQDDIPDLVFSNAETFSIALGSYDSSGHVHFTMVSNQAFINSVYFTQMQAADWDNDGDFDLIPGIHYVSEYHSVLSENNNGHFADTAVRFSAPFPELRTIQFHDFDRDGFVDAFFPKNNKTYIRNGETAVLLELPFTPNGTTGSGGLTLLDINRDGWMDVLIKKQGSTGPLWYLSLGKSGFEFEPELFLNIGTSNYETKAGDFDGDGVGDFTTRSPYPIKDTLLIRTNLLSGNPNVLPIRVPDGSRVYYPDINDDGLTDVVFAFSDTFHLRLNLGGGQFEAHHFLGRTPQGNSINNHAFPIGTVQDFFSYNFSLLIRHNFYFQNGEFTVTSSENIFNNGLARDDNYTNACLADLDGNGIEELVMGMWNNRGIVTASLSDSMEDSRVLYSDFFGESITGLEAADFDLDGRDELVFADRAGALHIGRLDSSGKFQVDAPLLVNYDLRNLFVIKTADFDGNGFVDFLYSDNTNDDIYIMSNENGKDFTRHLVISDFNIFRAKVVDYNADGLPDILIQPYPRPNTSGAAYIFENEGNFVFSKTNYSPPGSLGRSPDDGPLSKTIVCLVSNELQLLDITPNGFQTRGSVEVALYPQEYALFDYNRDSLPDLYYNTYPGRAGYICLNNGDGTFLRDAVLVPHIELNRVFDLENDGFPEILAINRRDWMLGTIPAQPVVALTPEPKIEYDLTLSPSPTQESLMIQDIALERLESVDIYSFSGVLCKRILHHSIPSPIFVGDLASGGYILVARFIGGEARYGRFVKI